MNDLFTPVTVSEKVLHAKKQTGFHTHRLNEYCRKVKIYSESGYRKRRQLLIFKGWPE